MTYKKLTNDGLSQAASLAEKLLDKMDGYDPSKQSEVIRFIRDAQTNPELKVDVEKFLMTAAHGMIHAIAKCRDEGAEHVVSAGYGDIGEAENERPHKWFIWYKDKARRIRGRMAFPLDRGVMMVSQFCQEIGPLHAWKWCKVVKEMFLEKEDQFTEEEKQQYKAINQLAVCGLFVVATAAEEISKVCLGNEIDGSVISDEGKEDEI